MVERDHLLRIVTILVDYEYISEDKSSKTLKVNSGLNLQSLTQYI